MLPGVAITFANHLIADKLSAGWKGLSEAQQIFDQKEKGPRGVGYAARLASIYEQELQRSSAVIVESLKEAHMRFGLPLGADVLQQLLELADKSLRLQVEGLQGAHERHVARFGIVGRKDCLGYQPQLQHAFIQNILRKHFWTLENVPVTTETPPQPMTMNFHGPVGTVQTGAHAVANVSQSWTQENMAAVISSLAQFQALLQEAKGIDPAQRLGLVNAINDATNELTDEAPRTGNVVRWLGAVGDAVKTVGSLQPAWEGVKAALRVLGLPF